MFLSYARRLNSCGYARKAAPLPSTRNCIRGYVVGYSGVRQDIPRVTGKDLHWACREGERPVIIDARPKQEYDMFHILGTLNIPLATFKPEDLAGLPTDRPVYVCSGHDSETLAVGLAEHVKSLPHSRVHVVLGGPDVIRQGGFLYYKDYEAYDKYMITKKLAAEAAKQKK